MTPPPPQKKKSEKWDSFTLIYFCLLPDCQIPQNVWNFFFASIFSLCHFQCMYKFFFSFLGPFLRGGGEGVRGQWSNMIKVTFKVCLFKVDIFVVNNQTACQSACSPINKFIIAFSNIFTTFLIFWFDVIYLNLDFVVCLWMQYMFKRKGLLEVRPWNKIMGYNCFKLTFSLLKIPAIVFHKLITFENLFSAWTFNIIM